MDKVCSFEVPFIYRKGHFIFTSVSLKVSVGYDVVSRCLGRIQGHTKERWKMWKNSAFLKFSNFFIRFDGTPRIRSAYFLVEEQR